MKERLYFGALGEIACVQVEIDIGNQHCLRERGLAEILKVLRKIQERAGDKAGNNDYRKSRKNTAHPAFPKLKNLELAAIEFLEYQTGDEITQMTKKTSTPT